MREEGAVGGGAQPPQMWPESRIAVWPRGRMAGRAHGFVG